MQKMQTSMVWRLIITIKLNSFPSFNRRTKQKTSNRLCVNSKKKKYAYLMEFAALNGFARREFLWLRLFFRLNDMRLRNWRKSKLRIVSMVDSLNKWCIRNWRTCQQCKWGGRGNKTYQREFIWSQLFCLKMMLTNRLICIPMDVVVVVAAASTDGMLHGWRWWNVSCYRHTIGFTFAHIQWIRSQWWFFQRHSSKEWLIWVPSGGTSPNFNLIYVTFI